MARILVPTTGTVIASTWGKSVADALNDAHVQAGFSVPTTNASGQVTITFPVAFQSAPTVVACTGTSGIPGTTVSIVSTTATTVTLMAYNASGGAVVSSPQPVSWIAFGPRA